MPIDAPTLSALLGELKELEHAGQLKSGSVPIAGGGRYRFQRGRDVGLFSWPGVGEFRLDAAQQEVVAVLLDAHLTSKNPDVGHQALLRASGSKHAKLAEVFAGSDAWGVLVLPGRTAGTCRLAPSRGGPMIDVEEQSVEADFD